MKQAVSVIFRRPTGEVTLQLRDEKEGIAAPGYWGLPGGAARDDEDPRDAAMREFFEETNILELRKEKFRFLDIYPSIFKGDLVFRTVFVLENDGARPVECYEGQKMEEFFPEEIPFLGKVSPEVYPTIRNAEKRYPVSGRERR